MNEQLFKLLSIVAFGKAPRPKLNCFFTDFSVLEHRVLDRFQARVYESATRTEHPLRGARPDLLVFDGKPQPVKNHVTDTEAAARIISATWNCTSGHVAKAAVRVENLQQPKVNAIKVALHIGESMGVLKLL